MSELRNIPNVGKTTEQDLIAMGYTTIESLKGKKADELYAEECALRGCVLDRCQLYLYRAVEYFVNTENPDPMKCPGCRKIKGKVFWLRYTGDACCRVYDCCVNRKHWHHCGKCAELPCYRFSKDPTISDEQNAENLRKMLDNLDKANRQP